MDELSQIIEMFRNGIVNRSTLAIEYHFPLDTEPTLSDLAEIESSVCPLVEGIVRHLAGDEGCALPEGWLRLDSTRMRVKDDGENTVRVEIDFAKLFPEPAGLTTTDEHKGPSDGEVCADNRGRAC